MAEAEQTPTKTSAKKIPYIDVEYLGSKHVFFAGTHWDTSEKLRKKTVPADQQQFFEGVTLGDIREVVPEHKNAEKPAFKVSKA